MHLMDVITTYLYGSIDNDIYIYIYIYIILPEVVNAKPRSMCSIKLKRLYIYIYKSLKDSYYLKW